MSERWQSDSDLTPAELLEQLERAAELWGASFTREGSGGRLELPVLAGLKHGLIAGSVSVEPQRTGSRVVFLAERQHYRIQTSGVVILALGAAGGIAATLWPFFPALASIAPVAIVVAIAAWILVASRLRTSTPEEFLDLVAGAPDPSSN